MRRMLLVVALLCGAIVGLVGSSTPSGALTDVLVDFGTTVESDPVKVSPAGGLVRYVVTFTNTGAIEWTGSATDATTGGGTFVGLNGDTDGCAGPAAGTPNPIVSCDLSLPAGGSKTLGVVVRTPSTGGQLTNTSAVVADPLLIGGIPDDNATNDSAAATTTVVVSPAASAAYLQQGQSLRYRNHTMTVLEVYGAGGGVVATMSDSVVTPGTLCGDRVCSGEGLHYDFEGGNDGELYEGRVAIRVQFSDPNPCFGYGNENCYALYYRLTQTEAFQLVPGCEVTPTDSKVPCIASVEKVNNQFVYNVEANTNDPDLIGTVTGPLSDLKG